jgi:hypothetical protein
MQAFFHSRVVLMLHQRQQDEVALRRKRMRPVLFVDKTDVEQCLRRAMKGELDLSRAAEVASAQASLWPRWFASLFFLQTKQRSRHAGVAASHALRTALPKPRWFSFFS